jgi:hypothetical protein
MTALAQSLTGRSAQGSRCQVSSLCLGPRHSSGSRSGDRLRNTRTEEIRGGREGRPKASSGKQLQQLALDLRHIFVPCTERLCKLVPSLTKHSETSRYILLLADKIFQVRKERKVQRLPKTHLVIPHLDSRWLKAVSQK